MRTHDRPRQPHGFLRALEKRRGQIVARLEELAWVRPAYATLREEQHHIDALLLLKERQA